MKLYVFILLVTFQFATKEKLTKKYFLMHTNSLLKANITSIIVMNLKVVFPVDHIKEAEKLSSITVPDFIR